MYTRPFRDTRLDGVNPLPASLLQDIRLSTSVYTPTVSGTVPITFETHAESGSRGVADVPGQPCHVCMGVRDRTRRYAIRDWRPADPKGATMAAQVAHLLPQNVDPAAEAGIITLSCSAEATPMPHASKAPFPFVASKSGIQCNPVAGMPMYTRDDMPEADENQVGRVFPVLNGIAPLDEGADRLSPETRAEMATNELRFVGINMSTRDVMRSAGDTSVGIIAAGVCSAVGVVEGAISVGQTIVFGSPVYNGRVNQYSVEGMGATPGTVHFPCLMSMETLLERNGRYAAMKDAIVSDTSFGHDARHILSLAAQIAQRINDTHGLTPENVMDACQPGVVPNEALLRPMADALLDAESPILELCNFVEKRWSDLVERRKVGKAISSVTDDSMGRGDGLNLIVMN